MVSGLFLISTTTPQACVKGFLLYGLKEESYRLQGISAWVRACFFYRSAPYLLNPAPELHDELGIYPANVLIAEIYGFRKVVSVSTCKKGKGTFAGQKALIAKCAITIESLPPEKVKQDAQTGKQSLEVRK